MGELWPYPVALTMQRHTGSHSVPPPSVPVHQPTDAPPTAPHDPVERPDRDAKE